MTEKIKDAQDVFRLVAGDIWDVDQFMEWYQRVRTREYSAGYKDASEIAYRNGGGFEF